MTQLERFINGVDRLEQLQRSFLVHSFLYYHLNESILSDEKYDECCEELIKYREAFPKQGTYYMLCEDLDKSHSGFYIKKKDYPPQIIAVALRLLWQNKAPNEPFEEFAARKGYRIVSAKTEQEDNDSDTTGSSFFLR